MPEQDSTGNDVIRTERSEGDTFFQELRVKALQRQEFAEAIAREASAHPSVVDLAEVQRKNTDQITQLIRNVGRLRRNMIATNVFSGSVVVALLALAAFLYLDPDTVLSFTGETATDTGSANRPEVDTNPKLVPGLVYESDLEFEIRTDVDRKYQLIIRQLYSNSRIIRRPVGAMELRTAATEEYIQYMADVSRVIEEAAEDHPSPEILRAIVNLSLIGPKLRTVDRSMDLTIATQNQIDQISYVLRARDARSRQPIGILE